MGEKEVGSVLVLNRLVFDRIEFHRLGMKNDREIKFKIQVGISRKEEPELYCVSLILNGNKDDEYSLDIGLNGYFSFNSSETVSDGEKKALIQKNAVAIMMPYLRSQLSLLTAQPEVDCVVLPPFNINKMMEKSD